MNTHELPMILFTVLSQMSVGAFVALGVVQILAMGRYPRSVIDRLADPALLAIGPTLVLGLIASMFHMNDITNTFNVIRHVGSSWLSREIVFGVAFAALGFLFVLMQWRKIGSPGIRQALAALTALVGIGLVRCQAMIYYSLVTVPGWHHWATPLRFFGTTILLGALAVGVAMAISLARKTPTAPPVTTDRTDTDVVTDRTDPDGRPITTGTNQGAGLTTGTGKSGSSLATLTRPATLTTEETTKADTLLRASLRTISAVTMLTALALVLIIPIYLADLANDGTPAAATTAGVYAGTFFIARMILLVIGAIILAFATFRLTATTTPTHTLTLLITAALAATFIAEIMGRSVFYDSMTRIGM